MLKAIIQLLLPKKTPAELVKIRPIRSNDSENEMQGVIDLYKQMHDPNEANRVLNEQLKSLKEAKSRRIEK